MRQYGILFGCNDFGVPGAELRGCINDLRRMYDMLSTHFNYSGWDFDFLIDSRNTAKNQRALIAKVIAAAEPGDIVVMHDSSHGTKFPVGNKIEHANCCYGFDWNDLSTFMAGSEYQSLIAAAKPGVYVAFTTDSCNSGDMLKRGLLVKPLPNGRTVIPKFIQAPIDLRWKMESLEASGKTAHPRGLIGDVIDVAFSSGCGPKDTDYSADAGEVDPATGQEVFFGAFTKYFCDAALANKTKNFKDVIGLEVDALAADQFDQAPIPYGAKISVPYCPYSW